MAKRKYLIGGYDVTDYLINSTGLNSNQSKPEWGAIPSIPDVELKFVNQNGEMGSLSPIGLFVGKIVKELSVKIFQLQGSIEVLEWQGIVSSVTEDFNLRQSTVRAVSIFQSKLDLPALITRGVQTPAALSRDLFELFDIPISTSSFNSADAFLSSLVSAQVDPNLFNSTITLMEIQKQLATAGFGRIYFYNGEMFYEVFNSATPSITIDLTDRDFMTEPEIFTEERNPVSWQVNYLDGEVKSAGYITGDNVQSLDFGPSQSVKVTSLTAAQAIADNWESISNYNQKRIKFGVKEVVGQILTLSSFVGLQWSFGGITNYTLQIVSIDRTDPKYTIIEGVTV